jgi:phenylpropionate dioxygenase-like ring-hydroxylating dioxygenase large terminal subunit
MFLGHTADLLPGQSKSLEIFDNKKLLTNNGGTYRLGSNICPHQNSRIISGVKEQISCQYHGWSWHTDGSPKDSGFVHDCENKTHLYFVDVYNQKGLLFDSEIDLSIVGDVSFDHLVLDEFRVETMTADPRVVMDIFLDVNHIPVVHNGVYDLLGIDGEANVVWDYADWGSVQTVTDNNGKIIARWIAVYPYTMIEWQAGYMFITQSIDEKKIAIWKYKNPQESEAEYRVQSSMWETAFSQDKAQAEQMVRFPSAHLEEAKLHYRKWLQK